MAEDYQTSIWHDYRKSTRIQSPLYSNTLEFITIPNREDAPVHAKRFHPSRTLLDEIEYFLDCKHYVSTLAAADSSYTIREELESTFHEPESWRRYRHPTAIKLQPLTILQT